MSEYDKTLDDIKNTLGVVMQQFKVIPRDVVPHEWAELKKYSFSETEIPAKYRELMGLAVASAIGCPYCIHFHTESAKMNGATQEEIAETAFLTRFTTGWSAMLHATSVDLDNFKKEFAQAKAHLMNRANK